MPVKLARFGNAHLDVMISVRLSRAAYPPPTYLDVGLGLVGKFSRRRRARGASAHRPSACLPARLHRGYANPHLVSFGAWGGAVCSRSPVERGGASSSLTARGLLKASRILYWVRSGAGECLIMGRPVAPQRPIPLRFESNRGNR